jgi:hypothetical protein
VGFGTTTPVFEQAKTVNVSDRAADVTGIYRMCNLKISINILVVSVLRIMFLARTNVILRNVLEQIVVSDSYEVMQ